MVERVHLYNTVSSIMAGDAPSLEDGLPLGATRIVDLQRLRPNVGLAGTWLLIITRRFRPWNLPFCGKIEALCLMQSFSVSRGQTNGILIRPTQSARLWQAYRRTDRPRYVDVCRTDVNVADRCRLKYSTLCLVVLVLDNNFGRYLPSATEPFRSPLLVSGTTSPHFGLASVRIPSLIF